jgi:hypothetical protein
VYRPLYFYDRNNYLWLTAPKKDAEQVQVANVFFQRYKFLSKHLQVSSSLLIYICAGRQVSASKSAPFLAANRYRQAKSVTQKK